MTLNVGSMLVKAKFETGNMMSGLGAMNSRFKESQLAAKHATTAFGRMKGSLMAMGASAALTSGALLGMLMNAIMQSPFLSAAMEKLKNQMMLFGNAIARHLAPILEKVVDFVKWLREKFQGLPEPIQAAIVKFIAIGIILIGLISTLGVLGIVLGGIKTGLAALGITGVITKFGLLKTAIGASSIAMFAFGIAAGIGIGLAGVAILEHFGVLDWFEGLGEKVGNVNAKLRDFIIIMSGPVATIGAGIRDVASGDFSFAGAKSVMEEKERAKHRFLTGTSETGGYDEQTYLANLKYQEEQKLSGSSIDFVGPPASKKVEIASQTNITNIDMSNVIGNVEDPAVQAYLQDLIDDYNTKNQEKLNV